MYPSRVIVSHTPEYAEAVAQATAARHHAHRAMEARVAARFYAGSDHGLDPVKAGTIIDQCVLDGVQGSIEEADHLRALNEVLGRAGALAGEAVQVDRWIFLVSSPGQMACYLGCQLPTDEELAHAFEPAEAETETDRSALAERQMEYGSLVHIPR